MTADSAPPALAPPPAALSGAPGSVAPAADAPPDVSIVVPVFDEEGAVEPLAREIAVAFAGWRHEILFVDDASRDATAARLAALQGEIPGLRVLRHRRNAGQSRAIRTGVQAARAPMVVMLDGDGQNDPADAPRLALALQAAAPSLGLIGGERRVRRRPPTPAVASRPSGARRSWRCPTSTTCTDTCRP
jgi:glycosyltransferase involved in cell wall biosynthesis